MLGRRRAEVVILMFFIILIALYIGPMDGFRHGHYYEEYDCSQIHKEDWGNRISLEDGDYEMEFSPKKDYLNGFSIFLCNQPNDNEGKLLVSIRNEKGKIIDVVSLDLNKICTEDWYKISLHTMLKKDKTYKLRFSVEDCKYYPSLQNVHRDYLPVETENGNILIAYAYAKSTFTKQERVMIVLFVVAICTFLAGFLMESKKKILWNASVIIFLVGILSWNYMNNTMDYYNTMFNKFQIDSETLASNVITAEQDKEYFRSEDEVGYGLGRYYDLKGPVDCYDREYLTDENWRDGYSRKKPAFIINTSIYSKEVAVVGNIVRFSNGEEYSITSVDNDDEKTIVYLDYDKNLSPLKNGSLDEVKFFDGNHNPLHKGFLGAYKSQYGLQGKIFRHLARFMEKDEIINDFHLVCCMITAIVFVLITIVLSYKYNKVFAGCFLVTVWLSPWVICFARNLYWVEFTWFIPMLVGCICSWKIKERKYRVSCYVAAFVAICLKSLCGYEYISVVMMGLISFLLVDAVAAMFEKKRDEVILGVRTIFVIGLFALLGFMLAIIIHSNLKGNGNVVYGIQKIIEQDVLRRTKGGDMNEFPAVYWASFNASVWQVYSKYFEFDTQIVTGIEGNLFPLLCIIPLIVFLIDYKNRRLNIKLPIMYIVFFLTSISWFCLAKGHSYIHTTMNYVLWYFGFIQLCIYVIVDKIIVLINTVNTRLND